ncbi:SDR family oxidoreductase [Kribbella sp. CA-247076]|uniref:SDR family oxidoreductase n=1 Tax=Kribbella sp. CA-247076 TaxID=3239941 RepID=UPI003D8BD25A
MKIVVIGGTGLIGSKLVRRFEAHGHEAVAASPNTGVNTLTGEGLSEAFAGASVVVDVSNSPSFEAQAVMDFFTTSTANQLAAEKEAGVGHHVAVSIVGTERMPENDYFAAKLAQEKLIKESGIPYSLVHATQFFEFVKGIADTSAQEDGVHIAPVGWQPIAGDDVADQVAKTAVGEPLNGRRDIAGPDRYRMDEFFQKALAELGDPREVITDPKATYFGSQVVEDSLVPIGEVTLGRIHYGEWAKS